MTKEDDVIFKIYIMHHSILDEIIKFSFIHFLNFFESNHIFGSKVNLYSANTVDEENTGKRTAV